MNDYIKRLETLLAEIQKLEGSLKLEQKRQRILELEDAMQDPGFWNDQERAQQLSQEYKQLKDVYDFWTKLAADTTETIELLKSAPDDWTEKQAEEQVSSLESSYHKNRLVALLGKQYDDHDAMLSIHAGAGGTDAQDWVEMLLRMILRYCEQKKLATDIIDQSKGSEAGIKSVTIHIRGAFAYGYLKGEAGVHRLVRLSPFNPAHTRETSFALVEVIPALEEKEIELDPKDLDIEANTSSGHGGQSVNTTYSAIRITHKPTGIRVSIQNERSQHQNKELALKILAGKLQALEDERLQEHKKELRGEFKSAEWGNQIRSYVLHPYKLVKDHRTNFESTDPDSVLDGELDEFIERYLEQKVQ